MKLTQIKVLADKVKHGHVNCGDETILSLGDACLRLCALVRSWDKHIQMNTDRAFGEFCRERASAKGIEIDEARSNP